MEVVALVLGTAIILLTAGLTAMSTRLGRSRSLGIDPDLQKKVQALSSDGRVRLEPFSARGSQGIVLVVRGICDRLWLSREEAGGRPPEVPLELWVRREVQIPGPRAADLETDDPRFDAAFRLLGPPAIVHAILTDEVRLALIKLSHLADVADILAEKGDLRLKVVGFSATQEDRLKDLTARALELAPGLALPDDLAGRLAKNARESRLPAVRIRQLVVLSREFPGLQVTRDALWAATRDPDPEVRLRGAIVLGEDGGDTLLSLALDEGVDDSCAARAVDALGARLPVDQAAGLIARGPLLARFAIAALARARAEAPLIAALAAPDARVRLAAAEALAEVGSAAAVVPLEEAGNRWGGELEGVAGRAVAEIQGRLVGAAPGQVSLAESDSGRLSLTDDRAGEVSLSSGPDPKRGPR